MTCPDCGEPSERPLCRPCGEVAAAFGYSVEERLTLLGVLF